MKTLEELSQIARELSGELFHTEETPCSGGNGGCLRVEEARPLTRAEKQAGLARRPFDAYDHSRLCAGCRAYWFAEMAAQTLHRMHCIDQKYRGKPDAPTGA
jgi:hypothetical protein